jgi:multicomponent Na+:H+ antiporter subunit E
MNQPGTGRLLRRIVPLWLWCYLIWVLLTWTQTLEQLVAGAAFALMVAVPLAAIGIPVPPWRVLSPHRIVALVSLLVSAAGRIVVANCKLAYRIWSPSRPLTSGMVIVPTEVRSDGAIAAVGLITSLIVDNQIVDVDRARGVLMYHAVAVPEGGPDVARAQINGPVEELIHRVEGRRE